MKPKRHPSLIPVSHEHREILSFCWKIRQGLKNNTSTQILSDYAIWFWDNYLQNHFKVEEEQIFNLQESASVYRQQLKSDHDEIRNLLTAKNLKRDAIEKAERKLYRHIRFEEREVFPNIQMNDRLNRLENLNLFQQDVKSCAWIEPFWE